MTLTVEPFVVAAAVAVAAWACAKEEVFRELREWCQKVRREGRAGRLVCKALYMPTCEYCASFWVTLVAVAALQYPVLWDGWRGLVLAQFFTWSLAVAYMAVYQLVRVDIRLARAKADATEEADPGPARGAP